MENKINSDSHEMTVTLPPMESIRKATVGETYRYFKTLIKGKSIKNLDECISSIGELPSFDDSLKLILIDSLQLEKEVFKILLSQNENQIKRVLQCKWFFRTLPAEFCTKEIFPFISFSLRCKIINKLSRHLERTDEAEKYFEFIKTNYDNVRAYYLLPRCSSQFIVDYVKEVKPTFEYNTGSRVLLNICKRYPETGLYVLSTIFDKKNDYNLTRKLKVVMTYLAGYHSDLMVPFFKKFSSYISFGRKLTRKMGAKLRADLFPGLHKHITSNEKALFSVLSFEEKAKLIAAVVRSYSEDLGSRSWSNSTILVASLLNLAPQGRRLELIDLAFRELYNMNYSENPKYWNHLILESLPIETRRWYLEKLEKFTEEGVHAFRKNVGQNGFCYERPEDFLYLYEAGLAVEKLKEILWKTSSTSKRESIFSYMVKTCQVNKDVKTLQEVAEFVATRHRNDDHSVIFGFMDHICDNFPFSMLNSAIYEKLDDLAYFCTMRGSSNEYVYNLWRERHIYYRLDNDLDVGTHVKTFFEKAVIKYYNYTFVRDLKTKHSKTLILALCKEAVLWIRNKTTAETQEKSDCILTRMVETCSQYNKLNKSKRILFSEIPGLEDILKEKLKEKFGSVGGEDWPLEIWDKYSNDVTNTYYQFKCLYYVFKRRPDLIEEHLEGILKILCTEYFPVYNGFLYFLMKWVSFYGKTEKMKELILREFENGESAENRRKALLLYSHMCTAEEFAKVIENYLPKQEKLEPGSDEDFDKIQISVPRLIKNVKPRWKNLQLLLKFFFGDFLKSVLSSFYSCCFNTRCDLVIPFLKKQLEEVPPKISYVKDIIRLLLELSDRRGRTELCLRFWGQYEHYSVRNIVLDCLWRSFNEQRTQESFQVLEKCILDCDETTIDALPFLGTVPEEVMKDYVPVLWRFSETQKPNFRINYRSNLLDEFTEDNINCLSPEFCELIIKNHLFENSSEIPVDGFAASYLAANQSRAFMFLDLIKDRKPDAACFYGFLNILISKSLKKPSDFADLFTVILENWPQYPFGVLYEERVLFTCHNIYQKVLKKAIQGETAALEFGKELRKFYSSVDNLNDLIPIYAESLKSFFTNFPTENAILTLKELVAGSQDRRIAVLAILSFPPEAIVWYKKEGIVVQEKIVKSKKEMSEFGKIVESYGDGILEIYLRSKFGFAKP